MHPQYFKANGKLLLTGEYFVLDGAQSLAVSTQPGQKMTIRQQTDEENTFSWRSFDSDGSCWFEGHFLKKDFTRLHNTDAAVADRLTQIFKAVVALNPGFYENKFRTISSIETRLDFPRQWGLGTSSTLIAMVAEWSEVDPYQLLAATFGGSGYDLACANTDGALLYQLPGPVVKPVSFMPDFLNQIYFVYLNQKQNSREGIQQYRKIKGQLAQEIAEISALTYEMLTCQHQKEFVRVINAHEALVSRTLKMKRARELYFSDFPGAVKSLGAWGGDFVMVTSERPEDWVANYFNEKGMNVFKKYKDLIREDGLQ